MRNVRLVQLAIWFRSVLFILPVLMLYAQTKGLSVSECLLAEAIFAAVLLVAEVPSGWISDIWKRKHVLSLGIFVVALGEVAILASSGFWTWTLGQAIIGMALISGTDTALIYDSLAEEGQANRYQRQAGRLHGTMMGITGMATLVGGHIYAINHHLPVILSAVACFCGVFVCFFIQEPERHKRAIEHNPWVDMYKTVKFALRHKEIAGIILFIGALFTCTKAGMWLQQPYYMAQGLAPEVFGYFFAGGFLVGWLSGELADWLERKLGFSKLVVSLLYVVPVVAFVIAGLWVSILGAITLMACSGVYGLAKPTLTHAIHSRVGPERRATILSTAMLAPQVGFIVLGPLVGYLHDTLGVQSALMVVAGLVFVCVGGAIVCLRRCGVV